MGLVGYARAIIREQDLGL
ncbi:Protein of unknown function [Bacillus cereus]|nr:Protein of unknown function [Bacillus cereus]SCN36952.1 Protein of unknown function [Bacillus wiedmannii]